MGQLIEVVPKTPYTFTANTGQNQELVLKERIDAVSAAAGVLVVRVHQTTGFASGASAVVRVFNQSVSREDPGTFFVGSSVIASVTISSSSSAQLLIDDLTAPIGPNLRVQLLWQQGASTEPRSAALRGPISCLRSGWI